MSYQQEYIQKLDREQSREIQNILSQVLSVSFPENYSMQVWLEKREGWVAVPTSATNDFTDFASAVLRLAADSSYRELLGVFLETEANEPVAFSVPSNIDGVLEFNIEPPSSHKVLFAGAPDWVILMAESDFYVVAGSVPTVEKFLNLTLNQAFTEFENYIESWEFPEQFAERLQPLKDVLWRVYRNTLEGYQNASVGSRVNLYD
ncbi:MAG TPA: hypothetical protein DEV81_18880 [Cyanobacteria bacterium UBA11049]|nr:hypothetical protein [Cyanobacteria bacterium UBA11049]